MTNQARRAAVGERRHGARLGLVALAAVGLAVVGAAVPAAAQTRPIRDRLGRTIAYFRDQPDGRTVVTDCYGATLGWTDDHATYDRLGARILDQPVPGVLVGRSRCAKPPGEEPR